MNELKDRIKQLRKELNLTQEAFSLKIGLARNSLASYEIGRREPTNSVIISICREFNVNENWLRTGEGEMFIKTDTSIIDQLVVTYNLDTISRQILETFLELTEQQKKVIGEYFKSLSNKLADDNPSSDSPTVADDIELELAKYRMELEAEKKGKTLSALDAPKEESKHA